VVHEEWGEGRVRGKHDGKLVVDFSGVGEKILAAELVIERGLLTRIDEPA
jgi:hypothetical protein